MNRLFDQNFRQRTLTAIIAAPIALAIIIFSWQTTALLLLILLVLGAYEYWHITRQKPSSLRNDILFGVSYLVFPLLLAIWLRRHEPNGLEYFLLVLVTNWTTDSAALIGGKLYGKRKFAPIISPKKTWEGVYTGVAVGFLVVLLFAWAIGIGINLVVILLAILLPVASIEGDLLESRMKRRFGVKDSGNLFPGHGGVLDRIDSPLFCLPIAAILVAVLA